MMLSRRATRFPEARFPLRLVRRPSNHFDTNAIEVWWDGPTGRHPNMLGHVPKEIAARLAPGMDAGQPWRAELDEVLLSSEDEEQEHPGVSIRIWRQG